MNATSKCAAAILTSTFNTIATAGGEPELGDGSAYALDALYTVDLWRNVHGGLRTGAAYLDNFDLTFAASREGVRGVPGLTAFAHVLHTNGARFSERYVGDSMTASNIDAPGGVRLHEFWMQWAFGEMRELSARVGLYDLNSEFDATDGRALFLHSAHGVGHELGQSGENGPSIFPATSLGMRIAWAPGGGLELLTALLDGRPGQRSDPDRSGIHLSSDEGALFITEAQWSGGRIAELALGHWRYTAEFPDLRSSDRETFPDRSDNAGTYATIEVALSGRVDDPKLAAFLRYGLANGRINEFDEFLGAGALGHGLFRGRPDDRWGVAFSWTRVGRPARRAEPREHCESSIELTWRAPINGWLTIQPEAQFIFNPGADPAIADSWIVGVRFEFSLRGLLAAASRPEVAK